MKRTVKTVDIKARMGYHANHVTALCPNGHIVAWIELEAQAGSRAQVELTVCTNGQANVYDPIGSAMRN